MTSTDQHEARSPYVVSIERGEPVTNLRNDVSTFISAAANVRNLVDTYPVIVDALSQIGTPDAAELHNKLTAAVEDLEMAIERTLDGAGTEA